MGNMGSNMGAMGGSMGMARKMGKGGMGGMNNMNSMNNMGGGMMNSGMGGMGGGMGGQQADASWVPIFRLNHNQSTDAHIADGPGHGADVFRIPRPLEHNGDMVEIDPQGYQRTISKLLKK